MSWESKNIEDCIDKVTYTDKIKRKQFQESGAFPIVSQEQDFINGYWSGEEDVFKVKTPVIIFGDHTKVLKFVDFDFVLGADGVKILQPKNFIYPKYFYYYLQANPVKSLGYARHYRILKELDVHYPKSIDEQKRIVAILDEAFAGIDQAIANTEKNLLNNQELLNSRLHSLFSSKHETHELESIVERLTNGYVGATRNIYKDSGIPYLLAKHVKNNVLNFDGQTFVSNEFNEKHKKSKLKEGDVLLVQSGHIGHSAVVTKHHEGHNCHAMIVITPKDGLIGAYLSAYFQTSFMKKKFQEIRTGSTVPHLTCKLVRKLKIPVPSISEQKAIIEQTNQFYYQDGLLLNRYSQKLNDLNELKQSLLQKAFSGELTLVKETQAEAAE